MQKLRHLGRLINPVTGFFALIGFTLGFALAFTFLNLRFVFISFACLPFLFAAFRKGKLTSAIFLGAILVGIGFKSIRPSAKTGFGDFTGFVRQTKADYFLFESGGCRYYVYEKGNTRENGDWLNIKGYCLPYEATEYESRFSFAEYLKTEGVSYAITAKQISSVFTMPLRFRAKEISFLKSFDPLTRGAIDSLLFGRKDFSNELVKGASEIGALYYLSASGVILGGALRAIEWLFSLRFSQRTSRRIAFSCGLLFLPLCVFKIGVWRVILTRFLYLFADWRKKEPPSRFAATVTSGVFLLAVNPWNCLNTGFLIGFGLSFFSLWSNDLLSRFHGQKRKVAFSVFNLIFLFPILVSGNAIHFLAFAYSLIFLPLISPFIGVSLLSFLTIPATSFLQNYASFLMKVMSFFAEHDVAIPLGRWDDFLIFVYYGSLGILLYFLDSGFSLKAKHCATFLTLLILLNALPLTNGFTEEVSFINVGQGDAILIRDGFSTVMIDTGGNLSFDMAQEVDIPFLRKEKVFAIDCLIASHGDYDHIGAGSSLINHFWVKKFVDKKESFPLTVGNLKFENLNCYGGDEENEESLVLTLNFMGKKWLFMGDAPMTTEAQILKSGAAVQSDILKVGHHGSASSSSLSFLKAVSPEVAVISVGKRNAYGHPDEAVLERFATLHIPIRRTDLEGTITFSRFSPFATWLVSS